ncbi:uncharacterized protein DUF2029 [Frondihabitans sp. PhB188]|nr:uncharacterized protein DUF2029 [Frondihabitans sp. PhB188]
MLWSGLVLVHVVVLILSIPYILSGELGGDLPVYAKWASDAVDRGQWPVFATDWVYPAGALLPIVGSRVLGAGLYTVVWVVLVGVANGIALQALIRRGRFVRSQWAPGFWVLTIAVLAAVDLLRLEGFTAPIVVVGMLFLGSRPWVAGFLLAAATWIKVWPAAVIASAVVATSRRWIVLITGAAVSLLVSSIVLIGGGGAHLDSFVTQQNGRALQVEAPLATPWLWMSLARVPGAHLIHNRVLLTEEVTGPGDQWLVSHATAVMFIVMAALIVVLAVATRRLSTLPHALGREVDLVLVGALALASAFIVFNKVGSPQYVLWLTPIVVVGLVLRPPDWKTPAILALVVAGLTTLVYPVLYIPLLDLAPIALIVLGARNVMLVVVLAWSVVKLVRAAFVRPAVPLGTRPMGSPVRSTSY